MSDEKDFFITLPCICGWGLDSGWALEEVTLLLLLSVTHKWLNQLLKTQKHSCVKFSSLVIGSHYLWEGAQNMCRSFSLPRDYFEVSGFWQPNFLSMLQLLPDKTVVQSICNFSRSRFFVRLPRVKSCLKSSRESFLFVLASVICILKIQILNTNLNIFF